MKKYLLFLTLVSLLSACTGRTDVQLDVPYVKYGLDSFPEHRVKEFLPYEEGQKVSFISDKGKTIHLVVRMITQSYLGYGKDAGGVKHDVTGWDEFYTRTIWLKGVDNDILQEEGLQDAILVSCKFSNTRKQMEWNVSMMDMYLGIDDDDDDGPTGEWSLVKENPSDDPDVIFQLMTNTMTLGTGSSDYATLEKGKGLTSFKCGGLRERWTLSE